MGRQTVRYEQGSWLKRAPSFYLNQVPVRNFGALDLLQKLGMVQVELRNVKEDAGDLLFGENGLRAAESSCEGFAVVQDHIQGRNVALLPIEEVLEH